MMKSNFQIFFKIALSLIILVFTLSGFVSQRQIIKQDNVKAIATGLSDTIPFRPNMAEGWDTYSSYINIEEDSVEFEVILKRNIPGNNDWSIPSLIGTIQTIYAPHSARVLAYTEPNRKWEITIQPDAGCFLRLLNSTEPLNSIVVIPIKTKYKQ